MIIVKAKNDETQIEADEGFVVMEMKQSIT